MIIIIFAEIPTDPYFKTLWESSKNESFKINFEEGD